MGYTLQMGGGSYRIAGGDSLSSKIRQTPLEISDKCSIFVEEDGEFVVVTVGGITQQIVDYIKDSSQFRVMVCLKMYNNLKKIRGYRSTSGHAGSSHHEWGFVSVAVQPLSLFRNKYYFKKSSIMYDLNTLRNMASSDLSFPVTKKLQELILYSNNPHYKLRAELQLYQFSIEPPYAMLDQDVALNSNAQISSYTLCFPVEEDGWASSVATPLYSDELKIYI